jgi:hypothetical protein
LCHDLIALKPSELEQRKDVIRSHEELKDLVGSSEDRLLEVLGKPDNIGPGSETFAPSGKLETKTDRALMYSSVLPNMRVFFEIVAGKVHSIGYIPK